MPSFCSTLLPRALSLSFSLPAGISPARRYARAKRHAADFEGSDPHPPPPPFEHFFQKKGYHMYVCEQVIRLRSAQSRIGNPISIAAGSNKIMMRTGNQLASSGCRIGRSILASRVLGVSPPASQLKPCRGQVGLLSCSARSSMTSARRGAYSHHLGVAFGASASGSRGNLPFGAGGSKLARGAALGNVDLSM